MYVKDSVEVHCLDLCSQNWMISCKEFTALTPYTRLVDRTQHLPEAMLFPRQPPAKGWAWWWYQAQPALPCAGLPFQETLCLNYHRGVLRLFQSCHAGWDFAYPTDIRPVELSEGFQEAYSCYTLLPLFLISIPANKFLTLPTLPLRSWCAS